MTEEKEKKFSLSTNPDGRKPIPVDEKLVRDLARIHCTNKEIADIVGVSEDTLTQRFSQLIEKGKSEGRSSIRRMQYKKACEGSVPMLIWLGKQLLQQTDRQFLITEEKKITFDEYVRQYRAKHKGDLEVQDAELVDKS